MSYEQKYNKYKKKYMLLKKHFIGGEIEQCESCGLTYNKKNPTTMCPTKNCPTNKPKVIVVSNIPKTQSDNVSGLYQPIVVSSLPQPIVASSLSHPQSIIVSDEIATTTFEKQNETLETIIFKNNDINTVKKYTDNVFKNLLSFAIYNNNTSLPSYFNDYNYGVNLYDIMAFQNEPQVENKDVFCKQLLSTYEKEEGYIRLVSFNVHNFHKICDEDTSVIKKHPKYACEIITSLTPNIVLFQEYIPYIKKSNIDSDTTTKETNFDVDFSFVDDMMTQSTLSHSIKSNDFEFKHNIFMGKAIYCDKNIEVKHSMQLNHNNMISDDINSRGVLYCIYDNILVMNIHLTFGNIDETKKELDNLFNIANFYYMMGITDIIISGDFNNNINNTNDNNLEINDFDIDEFGFDRMWFFKCPSKFTILTSNNMKTGFNQNNKLDFIIVSKKFKENYDIKLHNNREAVIIETIASDHYPIFFDFKRKATSQIPTFGDTKIEIVFNRYIDNKKISNINYMIVSNNFITSNNNIVEYDHINHFPIFINFKSVVNSEPKYQGKMISYYYIYYNKNHHDISIEDNIDITKIINKYSFPCNLNILNDLTAEEKRNVIDNEFDFIKKLIELKYKDICVLQIPRILYDLYNILIYNKIFNDFNGMIEKTIIGNNIIRFDNLKNNTYQKFCKNANAIFNNVILQIIYLNKLIVLDLDLILQDKYIELLKLVVERIKNYNMNYDKKVRKDKDDEIENDVLLKIFNLDDTQMNIFYHILFYELNIKGKINLNKYVLYRSVDSMSPIKDGVIDIRNQNKSYSLSYNTSFLNGTNDYGACVFDYRHKNNFQGMILEIDKFSYNDNSDAESLFFIPPIHPFIQPNVQMSEIWHPRTKIGTDSIKQNVQNIDIRNLTVSSSNFDYWLSSKTMAELSRIFITYTRNTRLFNKYLKH